ncbi:MAG: hypothetical protein GAK38_01336 [Xylophilus sp.]|nr:MAG: hypothetical protein GAK38_01336 [Xylophilus sp.]
MLLFDKNRTGGAMPESNALVVVAHPDLGRSRVKAVP